MQFAAILAHKSGSMRLTLCYFGSLDNDLEGGGDFQVYNPKQYILWLTSQYN